MRQIEENIPFSRTVLVAFALWLLALRLAFQSLTPPLPDEAYYWLWGQRPSLGYYDHAPLQAWLLGLSGKLFGWNLFALRFPTLLTSAALAAIILHWTAKIAPRDPLTTLLILFSSPLLFVFTSMVFHDHLMLVFLLLATGLFRDVLAEAETGRIAAGKLYGGALALGLATLTKYNAVFLGLAFAASILIHRPWRILLKSPHLYLAAGLAIALQAPVLVWNMQHDFVSFRYNLSDRLSGPRSLGTSIGALAALFGLSLVLFSPFLVPQLYKILRGGAGTNPLAKLLRALLLITGGVLGALCFKGQVHYYWLVVALAPCFLLLPALIGKAALRGHLFFGAVGIGLFVANYTLLPFAALLKGQDSESALLYGWDDIAVHVKQQQHDTGIQKLMGTHYRIAAQLAFVLKDSSVQAISKQEGEFDIWRKDDMTGGETVLLLADEMEPLSDLQRAHFVQVTEIGSFPVIRFGYVLKTYRLYKAEGYRP